MTQLPRILYWLRWSWPDGPVFRALVDHEASMDLSRVLEPLGATVTRHPAERPSVPPSGADTGTETTPAGGDDRNPRHVHPNRVSSGNGTEFS